MSQQVSLSSLSEICQKLKSSGLKITEARKNLVTTILTFQQPFTAEDVQHTLGELTFSIHRATVYRDLIHFVQAGVLKELVIQGVSAHYYELVTESHHHHFVCEKCLRLVDVIPERVEKSLLAYEKELELSGLRVHAHQLKFYGLCQTCQKVL